MFSYSEKIVQCYKRQGQDKFYINDVHISYFYIKTKIYIIKMVFRLFTFSFIQNSLQKFNIFITLQSPSDFFFISKQLCTLFLMEYFNYMTQFCSEIYYTQMLRVHFLTEICTLFFGSVTEIEMIKYLSYFFLKIGTNNNIFAWLHRIQG